jgi:hypothetical protein
MLIHIDPTLSVVTLNIAAHRGVRGEGVRVNIGPPIRQISKHLLIKMQ